VVVLLISSTGGRHCLLQQLLFALVNPIDDDIDLAPAGHRLRVPALFMGKRVACRSN
jgi:hypothetical protein